MKKKPRFLRPLDIDLANLTPFGWFLALTALLVAFVTGYGIALLCHDFLGRWTKPIIFPVAIGAGLGWFRVGRYLGDRLGISGVRRDRVARSPSLFRSLPELMAEGLREASEEEDSAEALSLLAAWTMLPGGILGFIAGLLIVRWTHTSPDDPAFLSWVGGATGIGVGMMVGFGLVQTVNRFFGRQAAMRVAWTSYALLAAGMAAVPLLKLR